MFKGRRPLSASATAPRTSPTVADWSFSGLWDRLDLGRWLDRQSEGLPGRYRPSLMVEVWVALLLYGGGVMDDLPLLQHRGVRRLFGWARVPDPTTFGRWLRRCGAMLVPVLDEAVWAVVRWRWKIIGVPRALTLVVDSTAVLRYGEKQAGAEVGYNPRKPGRPSHHPLLAFIQEMGDCMGVCWRPGNAHTAAGAPAWIARLVERLRSAGVEAITVRLDKGFFSKQMVETLEQLGVQYLLKVPNHGWLTDHQRAWSPSKRGRGIFPGAETWTTTGTLWGARLLSVQGRRPLHQVEGALALDTYEVTSMAHVLTNIDGIHALTAWRRYNAGAVVEQRIEELGQLSVGKTAIDDLEGNALLWTLGTLAYQLLHVLRTTTLSGRWKRAQPKRLRTWLFRLPGKLTTHGRKLYLQLAREDPARPWLLPALRRLTRGPPPLASA